MNPAKRSQIHLIKAAKASPSYFEYYRDRQMRMAQLYCGGMCMKRIAVKFEKTTHKGVAHAIEKLMRRVKAKTLGQLGAYLEREGLI